MKKKDIILIVSILLVAVLAFIIIHTTKKKGEEVVVKVDNVEIGRYSLSEEGEYILNGGTHILVIDDGEAYLKYASCPDHYCVKQGKISYNNETLTCLPYKLTVTVSNAKQPEAELVS